MAITKLSDILVGQETAGLEDETVVLSGVMLLKTLTSEGEPEWVMRHFGEPSYVELVGALSVTLPHEQTMYEKGWVRDEDGD